MQEKAGGKHHWWNEFQHAGRAQMPYNRLLFAGYLLPAPGLLALQLGSPEPMRTDPQNLSLNWGIGLGEKVAEPALARIIHGKSMGVVLGTRKNAGKR